MHKVHVAVIRTFFRCLSAFALAVAAPAFAQVPAVVEEIKLVTADDSRASFIIRFSPAEPQYAAVNTNPTRPEVMMRSTLRAPRVGQRAPWRGIVRSTNFASSDAGLTLYFETAAPAKATVEPAGDKSIQITITKLTDAEALGSRPLGSSGDAVVPATNLPTYVDYAPGNSYELVPLKYADVSEIIGLLTQGETIQPNNIFIRRELPLFRTDRHGVVRDGEIGEFAKHEDVPLGRRGHAADRGHHAGAGRTSGRQDRQQLYLRVQCKTVSRGNAQAEANRSANAAGGQTQARLFSRAPRLCCQHVGAGVENAKNNNPNIAYCEQDQVVTTGPIRADGPANGGGGVQPGAGDPVGHRPRRRRRERHLRHRLGDRHRDRLHASRSQRRHCAQP